MAAGEQEIPRRSIIGAIAAWLAGSERLFLLVGEPGAGKTVAARQVLAAHDDEHGSYAVLRAAELAMAHFCHVHDERSLNPTDFVAALSDGLARTVSGFAEAREQSLVGRGVYFETTITQQIGVAKSGSQITGIQLHLDSTIPLREAYAAAVRRPLAACDAPRRHVLVVVDDLNASLAYGSIDHTIAAVLRMISSGDDALPSWLRFLVTSRPDALALRDLDGLRCEIDAELAHDEVDEYVEGRLGSDRSQWRDRIVTAARANFLVAKHMVDDVMLGRPAWASADGLVPQSLSEIYQGWVTAARESAGAGWRQRFLPILQVLAVARGAGLTPAQLAGITGLHRGDVREVVETMHQFLRTAGDHLQIAIYHDSFRDFLLDTEVEPARGHDAIVDYFVAASARDWFTADRYAVEHLATHASACGRMAELINSPGFLSVAEPSTLVPALAGREDANSQVYQAAAWLLQDAPVAARISQLELAARWMGVDALARSLADLRVDRPWQPLWTHKVRKPPSLTLGQITHGVLAMVLIEVEGRPALAVQGLGAGIWLLEVDGRTPPVPLVDFGWAVAMAAAVVDGRSVLLVSDGDRLALVEVPSKRLTDIPAGDSLVTALALTTTPTGLVAVTGHEDGVIRVLNVAAERVIARWQAHDNLVTCLDVEDRGDELRIISGGADGAASMRFVSRDGAGDRVVGIYRDDNAWVGTVKLIRDGPDTVALAGASDGMAFFAPHPLDEHTGRSWQAHEAAGNYDLFYLEHGESMFSRTAGNERVSFNDTVGPDRQILAVRGGVNGIAGRWVHGEPIAVTSGQDGRVVLARPHFDAETTVLWELTTSEVPVGPVLLASINSALVVLYAETGEHGAVARIDLSGPDGQLPTSIEDLPGATTGAIPAQVVDLATDGASLAAAVLTSGDVLAWEARSGDPLGHYSQKGFDLVAIAVAARAQAPILAAVGLMGRNPFALLMERPGAGPASNVDLLTSMASAEAIAITGPDGGELLVGGISRNGRAGLVRLVPTKRSWWRPVSRRWEEQPIQFPAHVDNFAVTRLRTLAVGPRTHVIACGSDYSVWSMQADGRSTPTPTLAYHFPWTAEPVLARWHGRAVLLVAAWARLSMRRLDDPLAEQPVTDLGHVPVPREITAIAALDVERLLVVGGSDGTVTLWRDGATTTSEVIHLGASVRQLVLCDNQTLLVSTVESTTALHIGPANHGA